MRKEEIISSIKYYQFMSNMDIIDIIEEVSGCTCKPMNTPEHIIVLDSVEMHELWISALIELGMRVDTVKIIRHSSERWEVLSRRVAYPGYRIDDKMVMSYIDYDDREYAYGLWIKGYCYEE